MNEMREVVYEFLSLPHHVKHKILSDLDLLEKDFDGGEFEIYQMAFAKAKATKQVDALIRRIRGKKLYIVAGNYQEAKNIADLDFQLHPKQWAYVDDIHRLRGLADFEIVFCGSWGRNRDTHRMHDILEYVDYLINMGRCKRRTFNELNRRNS